MTGDPDWLRLALTRAQRRATTGPATTGPVPPAEPKHGPPPGPPPPGRVPGGPMGTQPPPGDLIREALRFRHRHPPKG
jgi:hypothetical protein